MMVNFFEMSYRDIITAYLEKNKSVKAYKTKLADAANFQLSYLSQIRNGTSQLTPDQAAALCHFWQFSETNTDYFMTLVDLERAGTEILRERLTRKLKHFRVSFGNSAHIEVNDFKMETKNALRFVSSWHYAAIFTCLNISGMNTVASVAKYLRLDERDVFSRLTILAEMGLVREIDKNWILLEKNIHISSPNEIMKMYAQSYQDKIGSHIGEEPDYLTYFGYMAVSTEAYRSIRQKLVDCLKDCRLTSIESDKEIVMGISAYLQKF